MKSNRTVVTRMASNKNRSKAHELLDSEPRKLGKYQIKETNNAPLMNVAKQPVSLWNQPNNGKAKVIGNTNTLLGDLKNASNQVQLNEVATVNNKPIYYKISRQGKNLGWIHAKALNKTQLYLLPNVYTSQFWPSPADDACEVAALKNAMSVRGKALNVPLRTIVKRIPISKNPNKGYTANPYHYGNHATIYPAGLVKIARHYGAHARNITGASKQELIANVKRGNGVVFDGPYMMKKPGSDHDLTILGYRPGYFYVTDPFARHHYSPRSTWVSTNRMMRLFDKSFRGKRAMVVY